MVELKFVAYQRTLPSEQLLIVGSAPKLGEWQPACALSMVRGPDGVTHKRTISVPSDHDYIEYKYLLIDQNIPGHVKWENGDNRQIRLERQQNWQGHDYSFEHGDSSWIPYENMEEFLVMDDSEEENTTSADEDDAPDNSFLQRVIRGSGVGNWNRPPGRRKPPGEGNTDNPAPLNGTNEHQHRDRARTSRNANHSQSFWMFWGNSGSNVRGSSHSEHRKQGSDHGSERGGEPSQANGMEDNSRVPRMSFSGGEHKMIARRASEVSLQDGQPLYRSKALPLWLLWRHGDTSPGSYSPASGEQAVETRREARRRSKAALIKKYGRTPFWMLY